MLFLPKVIKLIAYPYYTELAETISGFAHREKEIDEIALKNLNVANLKELSDSTKERFFDMKFEAINVCKESFEVGGQVDKLFELRTLREEMAAVRFSDLPVSCQTFWLISKISFACMCHDGKGGTKDFLEQRRQAKVVAEIPYDDVPMYCGEVWVKTKYEYAMLCSLGIGGGEDLVEKRKHLGELGDVPFMDVFGLYGSLWILSKTDYALMCLRGEGGEINLSEGRSQVREIAEFHQKYVPKGAMKLWIRAKNKYFLLCFSGIGGIVDLKEAKKHAEEVANIPYEEIPKDCEMEWIRAKIDYALCSHEEKIFFNFIKDRKAIEILESVIHISPKGKFENCGDLILEANEFHKMIEEEFMEAAKVMKERVDKSTFLYTLSRLIFTG
jgi:hypothetical protein